MYIVDKHMGKKVPLAAILKKNKSDNQNIFR